MPGDHWNSFLQPYPTAPALHYCTLLLQLYPTAPYCSSSTLLHLCSTCCVCSTVLQYAVQAVYAVLYFLICSTGCTTQQLCTALHLCSQYIFYTLVCIICLDPALSFMLVGTCTLECFTGPFFLKKNKGNQADC